MSSTISVPCVSFFCPVLKLFRTSTLFYCTLVRVPFFGRMLCEFCSSLVPNYREPIHTSPRKSTLAGARHVKMMCHSSLRMYILD